MSKKYIIIQGGGKNYREITFLKGFSITTIVMMHFIQNYMDVAPPFIVKAASVGGTGVHVFFMCSAIGLYMSYLRNPVSFIEFLKSRMLKIYVPYIVVVVVSFFLPFMYEGPDKFQALLSHAFLYKMFIPQYEGSFGGQLWYISTLFQFYFVFIPLCKLKKHWNDRIFMIASIGTSICWWCVTALTGISKERIWGSFFLQYLWEFSLGMIIAEKLSNGQDIKLNKRGLVLTAVLGIGISAIASIKGGVFTIMNDVPAMMGYSALALLIYGMGMKWLNRLVEFISKISYELYLVHILIFTFVWEVINPKGDAQYLVGCIGAALSIVVAYVYHLGVEGLKKNGIFVRNRHCD